MPAKPKLINTAFIGDRLADTARALDVYPSLMATAITPMIETRFPITRQVECTSCVMGPKQSAFVSVARKMGIKKMIIERSPDPDLEPSAIAGDIKALGFEVDITDFSRGTQIGILETARALGLEKRGEKAAARYETDLDLAQKNLPRDLGKKVLSLMGMSGTYRGEWQEFLLVEERGLFENAVLAPAGCTNVGGCIHRSGSHTDKYDIRVIESLDGLMEANPDLIALTCEAGPGLMAIRQYIASHPEAAEVPAIANHAVFNLPHCCNGSPMGLPHALERWGKAFGTL